MRRESDPALLRALDRHFAPDLPAGRFARNVLLISLAGLLPSVALYVGLTPGFGAHLASGSAVWGRILRQVLTNGLPVVLVVNAASFLLFAKMRAGRASPARLVLADLLARVGLFLAVHAAVFALSAIAFGSFGGDPVQALRVVAPTLVQAGAFGNLSGAYLLATVLGALPLHVAALTAVAGRPVGVGTGLALGILAFALQAAVLTAVAALISVAQAMG